MKDLCICRFILLFVALLAGPHNRTLAAAPEKLTFGSKTFTESIILGEMLRLLAVRAGFRAEHRRQLGGTTVLWNALRNGDIDAYPEYTGTLEQEILAGEHIQNNDELRRALRARGLRMTRTLGFNNTYAIGVKASLARRLNLHDISDLRQHPQLVMGFSNEFMDRSDGWRGLKKRYRLPQKNVRGLNHDLAYRGIESGTLQVTDLYATDAEIAYYHLQTLRDDLGYFPEYKAVILYRADLAQRAPKLIALFNQLAGHIDSHAMSEMNASVKIQGRPDTQVAAGFLGRIFDTRFETLKQDRLLQFWQRTLEHLELVGISLLAAILIAIPLGILAARRRRLGQLILATTGILQTIPSLALFVFMIPFLGIGGPPAIVALFLYSLLPIVRNTHAGLKDIPHDIIESAQALGLPSRARMRIVELPLASRAILAGIKTSAVINVGTATLGALIGAGGYGQPILTGIRLDDIGLILQGAIPAAILALLVQGVFELIERQILPRSLRQQSTQIDPVV